MYRVAIVEDDAEQAEVLARMLEGYPRRSEFSVTRLASLTELKLYADEGLPDIALMDIMLGTERCDGIEAVKRFAPAGCGTQVIYVTGFREFCTKVYQTDHVYFLTKPVAPVDLFDALDKALANLERLGSRPVAVQVGGTLHALVPDKISFIESDRRKVRIHQGQDVIEAYASLAELAEKLPPSFVRCHKGFLVNMDCIAELRSADVLLRSGELVPMSQRRRAAVRDSFIRHLQGRL